MRTDEEKQKTENRKQKFPVLVAGTILFLLSVFCFLLCGAQSATTKVRNFSVPEYFDPPHEAQMKSLMEGAEAEPEPEGRIRITQLKMQTYTEDGAKEMLVTAPRCIFDTGRRTVSSAGPLQVQTADEKLLVKGEGFCWQQTNSDLIISNHVRTTIRGALTNSLAP